LIDREKESKKLRLRYFFVFSQLIRCRES